MTDEKNKIDKLTDLILPTFLIYIAQQKKLKYMQKRLDIKENPSIHWVKEVNAND